MGGVCPKKLFERVNKRNRSEDFIIQVVAMSLLFLDPSDGHAWSLRPFEPSPLSRDGITMHLILEQQKEGEITLHTTVSTPSLSVDNSNIGVGSNCLDPRQLISMKTK
ncbi:hypothetical protein BgiBS90_015990 [Biomphalaria glabrata]|nr:hypothetical protein BgiBS90_015990 [Biomphalaria glabrata]